LIALQNVLSNNRTLSRSELKKVTDIFTRMFHDPHGKVFSVFLDTLIQLVLVHHNDMSEWLYILLTRLLTKTGADMLGSVQAKVQKALDAVRASFPTSQQFSLLSRFLIDQTQSPNLKVKVAMLSYLHGLVQLMDPTDFVNSSDIRLAISRIITWTTEPKSVDVRKAAQAVLLALHCLNTNEFDVMMSVLPKTFQEGAERILQNRLRPSSQAASESLSPRSSTSPITTGAGLNYKTPTLGGSTVKAEPMDSEEIYNSIKKTSDEIHNLVKCEPHSENHRRSGSVKSEQPARAVSLASGRLLPSTLAIESRIPSFLQNLPNSQEALKSMADGPRGQSSLLQI
jgi:CLIP-associating protein 1/2